MKWWNFCTDFSQTGLKIHYILQDSKRPKWPNGQIIFFSLTVSKKPNGNHALHWLLVNECYTECFRDLDNLNFQGSSISGSSHIFATATTTLKIFFTIKGVKSDPKIIIWLHLSSFSLNPWNNLYNNEGNKIVLRNALSKIWLKMKWNVCNGIFFSQSYYIYFKISDFPQ